jgi:glycerol kinase
MWDAKTGACLADCVVWLDARTADLAHQFIDRTPTKDAMHFR